MKKILKGVSENILECIGNTPLIRINKLASHVSSTIAAKCEFLNPGGAVKDRIGLYLITQAEKRGDLKPGGTIVEATSGNTGYALATAGILKGYKLIFVMPDKMSKEKINALKAFGAKVVITPTNVEPSDPRSYYSVAKRLAEVTPNAWYANQYHNPDNPEAHYRLTGPEIWQQTEGTIDTLVLGLGTGGTMTGTARYLKEQKPGIKIVGVDPIGSLYYDYFHSKKKVEPHVYLIEGIGEDFFPTTADLSLLTDVVQVADKESYLTARKLLTKEGLFVGSSSGAALAGAIHYAEKLKTPENIVVLLPDSGNRYLTKLFNDTWMSEQGMWDNPLAPYGTVEEVITHRFDRGECITLDLKGTVQKAITLLSKNGISQLPIMDKDRIIGLVTEGDILAPLSKEEIEPSDSITIVMKTELNTLPFDAPLDQLMPIFDAGEVAIIKQQEKFLGLITKIDFIKRLGQN